MAPSALLPSPAQGELSESTLRRELTLLDDRPAEDRRKVGIVGPRAVGPSVI